VGEKGSVFVEGEEDGGDCEGGGGGVRDGLVMIVPWPLAA
jgi:hypothetical protein